MQVHKAHIVVVVVVEVVEEKETSCRSTTTTTREREKAIRVKKVVQRGREHDERACRNRRGIVGARHLPASHHGQRWSVVGGRWWLHRSIIDHVNLATRALLGRLARYRASTVADWS